MFTAEWRQDADLAGQAWDAAEACMGFQAPAHALVPIIRKEGDQREPEVGHQSDDRGLSRIVLSTNSGPWDIAHLVSHAWFDAGPRALVEGRAYALADCVGKRAEGRLGRWHDDGRAVDQAADLTTWSELDDQEYPETTEGTYKLAWRFARVLQAVLTQDLVETDGLDWETVGLALQALGEPGAEIQAMLDGGVEAQREGLADPDGDGVLSVLERAGGTDPLVFDARLAFGETEPGAHSPLAFRPVPPDQVGTCVPGVPRGTKTADIRTRYVVDGEVHVSKVVAQDAWELVRIPKKASRGAIQVVGQDLVENPHCLDLDGVLIRSAATPGLSRFRPVQSGASRRMGLWTVVRDDPPPRVFIRLWDRPSPVRLVAGDGGRMPSTVRVTADTLLALAGKGQLPYLGAVAAGLTLVHHLGLVAPGLGEALARDMISNHAFNPISNAELSDVRRWQRRIKSAGGAVALIRELQAG